MADNFLEYQREAFEARKAKKERERKKRLRKYLEDYKKKLAAQKFQQQQPPQDQSISPNHKGKEQRKLQKKTITP